jgi:hypothetical protein
MKLFSLFIALLSIATVGCSTVASVDSNRSMMDDGTIELTPEYSVNHYEGKDFAEVFAVFNANSQNKIVRLREGDSISVNGKALEVLESKQHPYYSAKISTTSGSVTFALKRAGHPTMTHTLQMPELGIKVLPSIYSPYAALTVPVDYVAPPTYVIKDRYTLDIFSKGSNFPLLAIKVSKENKYQFDRLPDIRDGAIFFHHIAELAPKTGSYKAQMTRQQHVVLSKMSDVSRSGWATLNKYQDFMIEVK